MEDSMLFINVRKIYNPSPYRQQTIYQQTYVENFVILLHETLP